MTPFWFIFWLIFIPLTAGYFRRRWVLKKEREARWARGDYTWDEANALIGPALIQFYDR